jgi:hypothetical protein
MKANVNIKIAENYDLLLTTAKVAVSIVLN